VDKFIKYQIVTGRSPGGMDIWRNPRLYDMKGGQQGKAPIETGSRGLKAEKSGVRKVPAHIVSSGSKV